MEGHSSLETVSSTYRMCEKQTAPRLFAAPFLFLSVSQIDPSTTQPFEVCWWMGRSGRSKLKIIA